MSDHGVIRRIGHKINVRVRKLAADEADLIPAARKLKIGNGGFSQGVSQRGLCGGEASIRR